MMEERKRSLRDSLARKRVEFDLFLSQLVYKNRVGYSLCNKGYSRWGKNQKKLKGNEGGNPSSYHLNAKKFDDGYYVFSISNQEVLSSFVSSYNRIILDSDHTFFSRVTNGKKTSCAYDQAQFMMLRNVFESIPSVLNLLTEDVLRILREYYRSHFCLTHISAYRTQHCDFEAVDAEVHAYKFHYDRHPADTLKLFVHLSDVDNCDGPFTFFDRHASRKILSAGYLERDNYGKASNLIESGKYTKYLTGPLGTAAICDTANCLHRASVPALGRKRDLLVFSFESSDSLLDLTLSHEKETLNARLSTSKAY